MSSIRSSSSVVSRSMIPFSTQYRTPETISTRRRLEALSRQGPTCSTATGISTRLASSSRSSRDATSTTSSTQLAMPLQFEDWDRRVQKKAGDLTVSQYPAYPIWVSTRDMARIGYLMLREGEWNVSVRPDHVGDSREARDPWCIPPEERSAKEARDGERQNRGDIESIGKAAVV